jgi:hypothetical protein
VYNLEQHLPDLLGRLEGQGCLERIHLWNITDTVEEEMAALARLGVEEAVVVTGLPVLWFDEGRRRLSRSLFGQHHLIWGRKQLTITIHKVIVLPQPFGGFYSYVLDPTGQAVIAEDEIMRTYALLDVGWNTTDMTVIRNLTPEDQWTGGIQMGVRHVIGIVGDHIRRTHGLDLKPREIEACIRQGRVEVEGQFHNLSAAIATATASLSDQLKSTSTELWDRRRLSLVLALGGGGAVFWPAIREVFPKNSQLLPDPALANARGFCYYAQRDIWPASLLVGGDGGGE